MRQSKKTLNEMVIHADDAKKVNPLDLSSDQDLTIGLMNMMAVEKLGGDKYSEITDVTREMRRELMTRIVAADDERFAASVALLTESMRLMDDGGRILSDGNRDVAYATFNRAYEIYSLFWGINMGLVSMVDVRKIAPGVIGDAPHACPMLGQKSPKTRGTMQKLGVWVKNAVNCCIE